MKNYENAPMSQKIIFYCSYLKMTYDFFEMRDLITVAHRGDAKVDAKPCGVSIGIRGEECLSRPRGGCHGPDGSSGS